MTALDEEYPYIETPRFLLNNDPFVSNFFRKELKSHQPQMFEWRWMEGTTTPAGSPRSKFKNQMLWHINQKYPVGTGRIVESWEKSTGVNFVELGSGYRLHCAGINPKTMEKSDKHLFLLDWLYKKTSWDGEATHDGIKRLKSLLEWMNTCPENPYNFVIFLPVGEDLLNLYSPHYKAVGYEQTNHSTQQLRKIYKYWLKGVETKLSPTDDLVGNYWRAEIYQPKDPIYSKFECGFPEVSKNR